jgi:predicted oxidoreductase
VKNFSPNPIPFHFTTYLALKISRLTLEKIYLSDAGPKVSQAVYGFWRWSNTPDVQESTMDRIVGLCLELGINSFDHADHYGHYECEAMFGRVMSRRSIKREDIVLFTKCGVCIPEKGKNDFILRHRNTSAKHITQTLEQSLRNLRTDYIDIFLLDGLDPISDLEETALALNKLKTAGKIKHVGIANFTVTQHQLLANTLRFPIVTNHVNLNVLNTLSLDNGQLDYSKQRYMRAIAAEPLAGGRIEKGTDLQAKRVRAALGELGEKYNANIESLAVAWINRLSVIPLIGSLDESRIRNIADSFRIKLDHEDWYRIYEAGKVWPD